MIMAQVMRVKLTNELATSEGTKRMLILLQQFPDILSLPNTSNRSGKNAPCNVGRLIFLVLVLGLGLSSSFILHWVLKIFL